MAAPQRVRVALTRNIRLAPHTVQLDFAGCEFLSGSVPGQFVMVRGEAWGTDPLLGRAFSILGVTPDGTLELLVKEVGKASRLMARAPVGAGYHVLGPLGTGFPAPEPERRDWLVAGGVGLAPLLMHAERAAAAGLADRVTLFYGGRTATDLVLLDRARRLGIGVVLVTEDGTLGEPGLVTAAVERAADREPAGRSPTLLACGPEPMLVAAARLARGRGFGAYLSLEGEMACGIGACLACAVPATGSSFRYTCVHGPVFPLEALAGIYAADPAREVAP